MDRDTITILDFGGQYSHLIARRIRELSVYSELTHWNITSDELAKLRPKGIILSGGPASVYDATAPWPDKGILTLGIPVLGICYGLQLMAQYLGGKVSRGRRQEYGKTVVTLDSGSLLFRGIEKETICWMSHGDYAEKPPAGFRSIAKSDNCPTAAIANEGDHLYGVQFHPEVVHTRRGMEILRNFVFGICGCTKSWSMDTFIPDTVESIRNQVGTESVLCALSGGVDSTVTALLVHKAVGDRLKCIFVDHGLLRKSEAAIVQEVLKRNFDLEFKYVDASQRFLAALRGVADPEKKRTVIGEEFIRIFVEEGKKLGDFQWLAQGTLYPDVIESAGSGSPASRIKSHHNVAGLPGWMNFKLLEPLRSLYKDEVRKVAKLLGLPDEIAARHPFPGPGLAVRIIGEVTLDKLRICREASAVVEEELRKAGLYEQVWQAFATVGDDMAVGVLGDVRKLGYMVNVRVVESIDGMTADWAKLPDDLLERTSSRITNEVKDVTWVNYAISSKPPSTIEPC